MTRMEFAKWTVLLVVMLVLVLMSGNAFMIMVVGITLQLVGLVICVKVLVKGV